MKIRSVRSTWNVQYLAAKQFVSKLRPERFLYTLLCEGQVIVKADFSGPRQRFDIGSIGHLVKELLENYGEVMAYESGMAEPPLAAFRAEYYDVIATEKAVTALHGFRIGVSGFPLIAEDSRLIWTGLQPQHHVLSARLGFFVGAVGQESCSVTRRTSGPNSGQSLPTAGSE